MKSPIQKLLQNSSVQLYQHHIKTQWLRRYAAKQARESWAGIKVWDFRRTIYLKKDPESKNKKIQSKADSCFLKSCFYHRQFDMWLGILTGINYEGYNT